MFRVKHCFFQNHSGLNVPRGTFCAVHSPAPGSFFPEPLCLYMSGVCVLGAWAQGGRVFSPQKLLWASLSLYKITCIRLCLSAQVAPLPAWLRLAGRAEQTETEPGSCRSSEHPPAAFPFEVLYGIVNHSKRKIRKSSYPLPVACFLALPFCKFHRLRAEGFFLFSVLCGAGRALTVSSRFPARSFALFCPAQSLTDSGTGHFCAARAMGLFAR